MQKCQCSQCGSTEFAKEGKEFLRCAHCHSLFRMLPPEKPGGKVIIGKGANVTFGSGGNVVIRAELIIENGAKVSFLGKLEVIQSGSAENIAKAKQYLKQVDE